MYMSQGTLDFIISVRIRDIAIIKCIRRVPENLDLLTAQFLDELAALITGYDHGVKAIFNCNRNVFVPGQLCNRAV